jgi:hypothetical protein
MSTSHGNQAQDVLGKLEALFEEYLGKKAPAMPDNIKETLVSFSPYLAIIGIVISVPALLALLGIGAAVGPFTAFLGAGYMMQYSFSYMIGAGALLISAVLEGLAIQGLFKREMKAWRLMYYSSLVSFAASVLQGSVTSAIVGLLIGMYILFQVREKYR